MTTDPTPTSSPAVQSDELSERCAWLGDLRGSLGEVIVGQDGLVDSLLVALLTGGHVLLEGVPGLAKSLAVSSLANAVGGSFTRLQFTPDLLPSDLVGTEIYQAKDGTFSVRKGPVFVNFILADEINRAPAKVQSALLEAMQERQVSIGGETHPLPSPFLVLATQNPLEQEGTYPLPEAQLDRFALKLKIGYPTKDEEKTIVRRVAAAGQKPIEAVATVEELASAREAVASVHLEEKVLDYIVELTFATREPSGVGLADLEDLIEFGTSPRATIFLTRVSRARAYLRGRDYVMPDDAKAMAPAVLSHRLRTTYEADARGIDSNEIVRRVLDAVPAP